MTPSKYQIAIEAIRTKEDYRRVLDREFGDSEKLHRLIWAGESLVVAISTFKRLFPGWHYTISEADQNLARIANDDEYFSCISEDGHFEPSPAKSLLIVMLMALEEIDKRGEA